MNSSADFVYYLCGNLVGLYAQMINEVTIRRAFLDRRGYIQSTIKKTFEKGQEVSYPDLDCLIHHFKWGLFSGASSAEHSATSHRIQSERRSCVRS
jgi:hypothetical protein